MLLLHRFDLSSEGDRNGRALQALIAADLAGTTVASLSAVDVTVNVPSSWQAPGSSERGKRGAADEMWRVRAGHRRGSAGLRLVRGPGRRAVVCGTSLGGRAGQHNRPADPAGRPGSPAG